LLVLEHLGYAQLAVLGMAQLAPQRPLSTPVGFSPESSK
jgi:hypothetical protein